MVSGASKATALRAMEALSSLPASQIGREFVTFLSHEKKEIRYLSLVKVQESEELLKDSAIRSKVAEMADDEDDRIRMRVLDILAETAPQEAARVALGLLKDPEPSVQQQAVRILSRALEQLGASGTTEDELLGLLTDGSEAVRNGVLEIIMKRPDSARILRKLLLFCKDLMGWMRDRTLVSLRQFSEQITDAVIDLMSDDDEDVRSMALMLGSTLQSKKAVPHIVHLLDDEDWWLRMIAAETLGKIGDPRALEHLVKHLDDADTAMACIEALARIGDKRATVHIARTLSMPQPEIRLEAIEALARLKDKRVLPVLEQCAIRDPSPTVKTRARDAIERISGRGGSLDTGSIATLDDLDIQAMGKRTELEDLLAKVREMGGSDLHIVVDSPPMLRLHGNLHNIGEEMLTPERTSELILAPMERKEKKELERDQQADFCLTVRGSGRYRSNVYVERKGLCASYRVIPNEVPTLADIGLPGHLADLVNYHQGLIVVAGPSGSGKSTTLAALVNLFNERRRSHILLLEDPIEFIHPAKGCLINQRQVGKHTRAFASALRGALRQDPDVIIVGEMREPETVMLAIEASETGHLVIGTMNTTSAPKTVDRIIDSFPVGEQSQVRTMLSETLKAVICQSLLPRADGNGRAALFEVMMGNLSIANLIKDNKTYQIPGMMQIGLLHQTVDKALSRLLDVGTISAEAAWMRASNKERFEHRVSPEFLAGQAARS
jgi:twitching motility protein PilT